MIAVDLGDLVLEYREPDEVAWPTCHDATDLERACERVAALALVVSEQLLALSRDFTPPITSFEER